MVWAALAAQVLPAVLGSGGGGGGGLGSLLGGGGGTKTEVSQSANNTTSVNLSSFLSNQSPDAAGGGVSGGASGSAQSASGSDAPLLPSPYGAPIDGFSSLGAEDTFTASQEGAGPPKQLLIAGGVAIAGIGVYALLNGKKRKR